MEKLGLHKTKIKATDTTDNMGKLFVKVFAFAPALKINF